jgi:HAMP domain-containing protein
MGSLWVMLAALIAVYFISEKIISPLKDMSHAAKSFALGQV